jgi:HPt (histidine-containing phosphotransfer) domain-containing protein
LWPFGESREPYEKTEEDQMSSTFGNAELLYSTLADDPDLGEIVDMFVDEMPERISNLLTQLGSGNWEELRRTAHQLKGAAGSYGFDTITPLASNLEDALRSDKPEEEIQRATDSLVALCQQATSGTP